MMKPKPVFVAFALVACITASVNGEESKRSREQQTREATASAPETFGLGAGARVRVKLSETSDTFVGSLLEIDDARLDLLTNSNGHLEIPRNSIAKLEVYNGKKRHALMGLLIGASAGALIGAIEGPTCVGDECYTRAGNMGVTALGAGVVGMIVGAFIKTDRWIEVPTEHFHVQVRGRRGGVTALARLSF